MKNKLAFFLSCMSVNFACATPSVNKTFDFGPEQEEKFAEIASHFLGKREKAKRDIPSNSVVEDKKNQEKKLTSAYQKNYNISRITGLPTQDVPQDKLPTYQQDAADLHYLKRNNFIMGILQDHDQREYEQFDTLHKFFNDTSSLKLLSAASKIKIFYSDSANGTHTQYLNLGSPTLIEFLFLLHTDDSFVLHSLFSTRKEPLTFVNNQFDIEQIQPHYLVPRLDFHIPPPAFLTATLVGPIEDIETLGIQDRSFSEWKNLANTMNRIKLIYAYFNEKKQSLEKKLSTTIKEYKKFKKLLQNQPTDLNGLAIASDHGKAFFNNSLGLSFKEGQAYKLVPVPSDEINESMDNLFAEKAKRYEEKSSIANEILGALQPMYNLIEEVSEYLASKGRAS